MTQTSIYNGNRGKQTPLPLSLVRIIHFSQFKNVASKQGEKVFCKAPTLCSPSLNFSLHYDLIIFLTHPLPADSMKHIIRVNLVRLHSESEHAFLPITAVDSKYSHSVSPRDFWDSVYPVTGRECGKLSLGHSAMVWLQRWTTQQCIRSECARNPTYSNTTLIQTNGVLEQKS